MATHLKIRNHCYCLYSINIQKCRFKNIIICESTGRVAKMNGMPRASIAMMEWGEL